MLCLGAIYPVKCICDANQCSIQSHDIGLCQLGKLVPQISFSQSPTSALLCMQFQAIGARMATLSLSPILDPAIPLGSAVPSFARSGGPLDSLSRSPARCCTPRLYQLALLAPCG